MLQLPDADASDRCAQRLANCLRPGLFFTLQGPVGAGKTHFIRALLMALGVQGPVKSPTYGLLEPYIASNLYLYHFDFYRFFDPLEWEATGFRDLFDGHNIQFVEWPEKAAGFLPSPDIELIFAYAVSGRSLSVAAHTPAGQACVSCWRPCSWRRPDDGIV
ncbi:MAG: tRNA (adenosine(37)-N6)-threonylcarbamoyltransferase complex ATPase subunit type 1 TsaE [Burkholderiaceae bacterium]